MIPRVILQLLHQLHVVLLLCLPTPLQMVLLMVLPLGLAQQLVEALRGQL